MGFFSWQCAKTQRPVMAEPGVAGTPWYFASDVIVLFSNGDRITGSYDGYGRVGSVDLMDYSADQWRMVIRRYYDQESFDQLAPNKNEPWQGWFWDDADLARVFEVDTESV